MFQTFKNAFKIPDLRNKILFTLFVILLYRIGVAVPVPYIQTGIENVFGSGSIFDYLNLLSGGALEQATLFALGVSPYINASIIIQLLAIAIPALEKLSKEGEEGRKKLDSITRYVTVALALVTSFGYYMLMKNYNAVTNTGAFTAVVIISCYCAGAALVMWLAEKIDEKGIGNGISMILFANIISRLPSMFRTMWNTAYGWMQKGGLGILWGVLFILCIIAFMIALVGVVVFLTESERKIPVQYAKRVVGRKMYGGQSSVLPIKLNMTGVMPIIFASSICSLPATIMMFIKEPTTAGFGKSVYNFFKNISDPTSIVYVIVYFILIIAFAYFYIAISFNPVEVANNLKKNGGFIPGIRPGKPTSDYISKILSKITLIGAIYLGVIAIFPMILTMISKSTFQGIMFGGSSLLIVVGVALETTREIEAQMTMRHYKGFLE
ncbi:MAG: preprotein translocase subunit SecY [Oscillospiraceae bacterium]|jgi:preprotein translocase, secY subunit|nr:MAG: preprotein translocase subunit SecY [Oscillospiraceae bacterium]